MSGFIKTQNQWDYYGGADFEAEKVLYKYSYIYFGLLEHDLSEMIKIAQKNNIKVIVSGYPRSGRNINKVLRMMAERFDVPFVDNYRIFENFNEEGRLDEYISSDDFHPNDKGYRIVAQNIFYQITESNILK